MLLSLLSLALAQESYPVWLAGSLQTTVGSGGSAGGGVMGSVGARVGQVGLEAGAGELYASREPRTVGVVDVRLRYPSRRGVYGFVGFTHHHETPLEIAIDNPLSTVFGVEDGIIHRSGFAVGGGWSFADLPFLPRIYPEATVKLSYVPDHGGPMVYGFASFGFSVGLGPLATGN